MSATANFAATPKSPSVLISTANTNRDGTTGVYGTVLTAGAGGSRIDRLNITATGTTTAGMIRLFLGTALIEEIPVLPNTPSATNPAWTQDVVFDNGLIMGATVVLKASTEKGESFNVTVISGGDF